MLFIWKGIKRCKIKEVDYKKITQSFFNLFKNKEIEINLIEFYVFIADDDKIIN